LLTAFTLPDVVLIAEVQLTFAKRFQGGDIFQILPAGTDDDGFRIVSIMKLISNKEFTEPIFCGFFVDPASFGAY